MKKQILEAFPVKIKTILFLQNYREIPPHQDGTVGTDHLNFPCDLRTMFYDENKQKYFELKNYIISNLQEIIKTNEKIYASFVHSIYCFLFN